MQALTARAVPEHLRGLAYGFLGSSLGLFSFFAPAVGGWLWKTAFPALPFLLSGAILLLAGMATAIFIGRVKAGGPGARARVPPAP